MVSVDRRAINVLLAALGIEQRELINGDGQAPRKVVLPELGTKAVPKESR